MLHNSQIKAGENHLLISRVYYPVISTELDISFLEVFIKNLLCVQALPLGVGGNTEEQTKVCLFKKFSIGTKFLEGKEFVF